MANQTVATRWLLSMRDRIKVSFVEHKWAGPYFTDIEIKIHIGGMEFSGRGTDKNGDLALEKASAEAIERWCCQELKLSTVGCAIHSVELLAEKNSKYEFIERFIFNKFIENGNLANEFFPAIPMRYPWGTFRFWNLGDTYAGSVAISISFDNQIPISIGIALSESEEPAAAKAFIEALRNFEAYEHDKSTFTAMIGNDPDLWCCDPQFLKRVLSQIAMNKAVSPTNWILPDTITISKKVSEILGQDDCPLYFSRTTQGLEGI